ncbi:hypothetical protein MYA98_08005 [Salmonella sp. WGH-01]|nr:hypothetical protein MYA98_08005 [Salmonella sp. WGH-01]
MQLGIALNTMGDARRGEEAITLALNTPRQDERQWIADYGSSLRDNALMLSLLEENNLRPDAQNALLSSLSEQAFGQRWLSTGEQCLVPRRAFATGQRGRPAGADLVRGAAAVGRQGADP